MLTRTLSAVMQCNTRCLRHSARPDALFCTVGTARGSDKERAANMSTIFAGSVTPRHWSRRKYEQGVCDNELLSAVRSLVRKWCGGATLAAAAVHHSNRAPSLFGVFQSPLTASRTLFTTFSVACLILPEAWSTLPSCFRRSSLVITPAAFFTRPLTSSAFPLMIISFI